MRSCRTTPGYDPAVRVAKKLVLSLGAGLTALVAANALLAWRWPVSTVTYRVDPVLLHDTIPGSRRLRYIPTPSGGERVLVRFDALGCRGPGLEEPKRRPRLVVVGDSFVLGANAPEERTFPSRLGVALGGRPETVNAGVESYGPDQTLLRLERDFERLDPDLVVLVLCATNDFGDLLRNKLFRLRDGVLERARPVLSDSERAYFEQNARRSRWPAFVRAVIDWRESRSAAAGQRSSGEPSQALIREYLDQTAWEYENTVLQEDPRVYSLRQDAYDADVAIRPESPSARYKTRLLTAVLERLRDRCSDAGVGVVAVIVPSAVDVHPGFAIRVDPGRYPTWSPSALTDAMHACARAAGIPALDLTDAFTAGETASLFVGGEDFHWSPRGMELAAKETAAWLAAKGLVP